MNIRKTSMVVVAIFVIVVPLVNISSHIASSPFKAEPQSQLVKAKLTQGEATTLAGPTASRDARQISLANEIQSSDGKMNPELLKALGIKRSAKRRGTGNKKVWDIKNRGKRSGNSQMQPQSGQPVTLNAQSALSAALITALGGRDNQFSEVTLIADWDGREDCAADREQKVDDFSTIEPDIDQSLSKVSISEHTVANGFNENVYYYGDTIGNFFISVDLNPGINISPGGGVDSIRQVNIPALISQGASGGVTLLNPVTNDCSDDQVLITGIAVNPVSDLGDFGLCGVIGEVVYVSTLDTEGCRSSVTTAEPIRTRVLAFGFTDIAGGVAPVGAFTVIRSTLANLAGLAVDDDSNLYFHQVDLLNLDNGGAVFKLTETPRTVTTVGSNPPVTCPGLPRINRVIPPSNVTLLGGAINAFVGTEQFPVGIFQGSRLTNYTGPSTTFGNIVAMDAGFANVLYCAVSRSFNPSDTGFVQNTEGLFTNPAALGPTPSMIITFADATGAFDLCSSPATNLDGTLPIGDGFADVAVSNATPIPGINNFRVFVAGTGPKIVPASSGGAIVPGTPPTLLQIDMQIDFSPTHSGISINEEGMVFVISGGMPAGVGRNSSPLLGEVLCFEDMCPMDRRADFVDLRGDVLPNPPASGGSAGDGDSDRFDHIFYQAPLDQVTVTPTGLSGLAGGFLLYINRTRLRNTGSLANLPNGAAQEDDSKSGPLIFEDFDFGHQVAGGDDQNIPNRGDDNDGSADPVIPVVSGVSGNPVLSGPLSGGFEFLFGVPIPATTPCASFVWNAFFLNSNGNITFAFGDVSNIPAIPFFRAEVPRIAPAWADLNTEARDIDPLSFPVQALGFANVNAFKMRWINVPEFGSEICSTGNLNIGGNTFSVTLYDDGTGPDENHNQLLDPADPTGDNIDPDFDRQEGPTDLRFNVEPTTGQLVGCPPRADGTGHFIFEYGRMDLLGTDVRPVITGYSRGDLSPLNPPGLCETNLSIAAAQADTGPFGVIQGQTATIQPCLIGEGTEPTIFELFNSGLDAAIGTGGEITFATPDFDLRFEGNDPVASTSTRQDDLNRGKVGFFGLTCPVNPMCQSITPVGTISVAPGQPAVGSAAAGTQRDAAGNRIATPTSGIINAICNVQLNVLGCGFFPNETTNICPSFGAETGVPLQRPGKTVTTSATIMCDTNGDGVSDAAIPLTNVTPLNRNLVRATLPALTAGGLPGTVFPLSCCGGLADLTITTTFTSGDNNIFGPFTRTTTCVIDLGFRAPVILSATPSEGDCAIAQDLLISGACFLLPSGSANVTSVFAVEQGNPTNLIRAQNFVIINPNIIDALFNFGSVNSGKTFLIFASGPSGTSQNLTSLPTGAQGCPAGLLGNQQGLQVTFRCSPQTGGGAANDAPVIENSVVNQSSNKKLTIKVNGSNIRRGAKVMVGDQEVKKLKFKDPQPGSDTFARLVLKGKFCNKLPGMIVIINPSGAASKPFQCNHTCN